MRRNVHDEKRSQDLGLTLPKAPAPRENCNACHASQSLLLMPGHFTIAHEGGVLTGAASGDNPRGKPIDEGNHAEKLTGLSTIATLKRVLGDDLDNVEQVAKMFGIANSTN